MYELRPYQSECLQAMQSYDGDAALCVLATGLGKTVILANYVRWEVEQNDHRCLILAHRDELVRHPQKYLEGIPIGFEIGRSRARRQKVVSASVQSLVGRLNRYNPRDFDIIIVDEAHHAAAPTYRKILAYFQGATVFGFTATAHRGDGIGLGCVFHDIIFERNLHWGIEHGYLSPVECKQVTLPYRLESVKIAPDGDFDPSDLAKALSGTALGVAEIYKKYARGPTIVFAASISEAEQITQHINQQAGKRIACTITGETPNREALLYAYEVGVLRVLVNFAVISEGTDLPCTETVIIAKPVSRHNVGAYAQMVGRGLRPYKNKASCQIIDCVGISNYPICTAATLIGKDLPTPKKEETPKPDVPPPEKPLTVLTQEQLPSTWIKAEAEQDILALEEGTYTHNIAWVPLPDGQQVLSLPGRDYCIQPRGGGTVWLCESNQPTLEMPLQKAYDAVYAACKKDYAKQPELWNRSIQKRWQDSPMTEAQYQLLQNLVPDFYTNGHRLTKGDAAALIVKHKYIEKQKKEDEEMRNTRCKAASGVYHVMVRGIDKTVIFNDNGDHLRFLEILNEGRAEYRYRVLAYCLMSNHAHILLRFPKGEDHLEEAMKYIGVRYVTYFNTKNQRVGSLFQGRYKSEPVEDASYMLRTIRYIHNNPVKAGIVQHMEEYPWSSYKDYFTSQPGPCSIETKLITHYCDGIDWFRSWHLLAETNENAFLDDNEYRATMPDEEARQLICFVAQIDSIPELAKLPEYARNRALQTLSQSGISVAQLSRLTGISKGIIYRARHQQF